MNIMPWEKYEYEDIYIGRIFAHCFGGIKGIEYTRTFQQLPDSKSLFLRKGDIVKFENGRNPYFCTQWQDWFLSEKDYIKYLKSIPKQNRNKKVPLYAVNQYAIVIGRYRIVKKKYKIYYDYGTVIMMLTGEKIGHIRRYYVTSPFITQNAFPHKKVPKQIKEFKDIILSYTKDSNECRDSLVSTLYKKLNN